MTNLEAILAEVEPYTPSRLTIEKALKDSGLKMEDEYEDERLIALATVKALSKMVVLSAESEGKFSQSYNEKLEKRILGICEQHDLDASEFVLSSSITDGSNRW
jgi:hypothetical protein